MIDSVNANGDRTIERINECLAITDDDLRDKRVKTILTHLCMREFEAGVDAAVGELLAQVAESGQQFELNMERPLFAAPGPLDDDWEWPENVDSVPGEE